MAKTKDPTDATAQIRNALVFVAYFGAALVAGGVAYNNAYNNAFEYDIKSTAALVPAAIDFWVLVIWNGGYWIAAPLFAIAFAVLFYAARFLMPLWLGYLSLFLLFMIALLGCVAVGDGQGTQDALRDRSEDTTTTPIVKLYFDAKASITNDSSPDAEFDSGDFHLLAMADDRVLVFVPSETAGSVVTVTAVKRSDIVRYEVDLR